MFNITQNIELEEHLGNFQPKDPWTFAKAIQNAQELPMSADVHSILFNKGRYFETSLYSNIIKEISELTQIPISYNTMIVASWKHLEDFVIAMNCLGIYVKINIDWV